MGTPQEGGNRDGDGGLSSPATLSSSKYLGKESHWELIRSGCRKLFELSGSSFGPHGSFKVIKANDEVESVTVTSISSEIFLLANFTRHSPILKLITQAFKNQVSIYGDAGHFFMQLCSSLILNGLDLISQGVKRAVCCSVYQNLFQKLTLLLQDPKCNLKAKVSIRNMATVRHIVRNMLSTKNVGRMSFEECNYISTLLLQGFLQSLSHEPGQPKSTLTPCIRYVEIYGQPVTKSVLLENTLVMDLPIDSRVKSFLAKGGSEILNISDINDGDETPKDGKGLIRIVVFDMALTKRLIPTTQQHVFKYTTNVMSSNDGSEYGEGTPCDGSRRDAGAVSKFLNILVQCNVGAVFSQKTIHPTLQEIFMKHKIIPVERLSIRHIKAIASVSGAKVLSDNVLQSDIANEIVEKFYMNASGEIDSICLMDAFNENYLVVKGSPTSKFNRPISTLILCSHSEQSVNELCKNVKRTVKTVNQFLHCPYVVPGAGAFEYVVSRIVDKIDLRRDQIFLKSLIVESNASYKSTNMEKLKRHVNLCKNAMVKAFQSMIVNLFGQRSRIIDKDTLLQELENKNKYDTALLSFDYFGCDIEFDSYTEPTKYTAAVFNTENLETLGDKDIVDVYVSKIEAIKSAVSIGGIVLRTNGTVYAQ